MTPKSNCITAVASYRCLCIYMVLIACVCMVTNLVSLSYISNYASGEDGGNSKAATHSNRVYFSVADGKNGFYLMDIFTHAYSSSYSSLVPWSSTMLLACTERGDVLINASGEEVLMRKKILAYSEHAIAFQNEVGLWGYMDAKGKVLVKPAFYAATSFSEGYAFVDKQEGACSSIINQKFESVCEDAIEYVRCTFESGAFVGRCKGSKALRIMDEHCAKLGSMEFVDAEWWNGGKLAATIDGVNWGIVDSKGVEVVGFEYEYIRNAGHGWFSAGKEEKEYIISPEGQVIGSQGYEAVVGYGDNVIVVRDGRVSKVLNTDGTQLWETKLELTSSYSCGYVVYSQVILGVERDGILDKEGKIVIEAQYPHGGISYAFKLSDQEGEK